VLLRICLKIDLRCVALIFLTALLAEPAALAARSAALAARPAALAARPAALAARSAAHAPGEEYFTIHVVDVATGRGVPLVELKTVNNIRFYTDSNGIVAFGEPGLMDREVFFHVKSHGYEFPKDGFGYRGVRLKTTPGRREVIEIDRINVAERLYRITGAGIYRDSVLVGESVPIAQPCLNGNVTGQDTVMALPHKGKLYWFYGDTNRVRYPLGNFFVSGAVSAPPGGGGLDPEVGVNLSYFVDKDGFSKTMCPVPSPGPVWIEGLMALRFPDGGERLVAQYSCMKSLSEVVERGLVVFDDEKEVFEKLALFDLEAPLFPRGQPVRVVCDGEDYFCFGHPHVSALPNVRVRAELDSVCDPGCYETFTPFVAHSRYDAGAPAFERDAEGRLVYGWKRDAVPLDTRRQEELEGAGHLAPGERWLHLRDVESGKTMHIQAGSVFWNEYRERWIMIACELFGEPSVLGETWFAEADTLVGPWVFARRIVTHDRYSFYNPAHHPFLDRREGRRIYFEGTYATTFSTDDEDKTPYYDYNQIMYGLSLDDPRLTLPAPVYQVRGADGEERLACRERIDAEDLWEEIEAIAFFAIPPGRAQTGLVPVCTDGGDEVTFYGLRPSTPRPSDSADIVPLYVYSESAGGELTYSIDPALEGTTLKRSAKPFCRVWKNPMSQLILDRKTRPLR